MKNNLKSIIALSVICAVISALVAATNFITAPIIEEADKKASQAALLEVMPNGTDFEQMDLSSFELPETVTEAYREAGGGFVVKLSTTGFNPGMVIMCGVDAKGVVTGATCLSSGETLGAEKTYGEKTVGKTAADIDTVDTVASMTKTTQAYRNAVKDALNAAIILGGGTVDLRSEEEILQEKLSAALPAAEGAFTKWFMVEELEGVSAVYVADNGAGTVFLKGEEAVIDPALAEIVANSKVEAVDASAYELSSSITKVEKTASGNYVFEINASGYGKNGDPYIASGEYIVVRASLTPAGKVIACETLSHKESEGFGDACAKPEFYNQFNGKDESNYKEIDGIGGATITTNGYKTAIGKLFEAVKTMEGVA